jgi:hypothetical protein
MVGVVVGWIDRRVKDLHLFNRFTRGSGEQRRAETQEE